MNSYIGSGRMILMHHLFPFKVNSIAKPRLPKFLCTTSSHVISGLPLPLTPYTQTRNFLLTNANFGLRRTCINYRNMYSITLSSVNATFKSLPSSLFLILSFLILVYIYLNILISDTSITLLMYQSLRIMSSKQKEGVKASMASQSALI